MRFEVAKREVEVGWSHVWFVIGVMFAIVAAFFVLTGLATALISFTSGAALTDSYMQALTMVTTILALLTPPLGAFLYVIAMPHFKIKKDAASCRSVVAAQFILLTSMTLVLLVLSGLIGEYSPWISWPFQIAARVAMSAQGAISLYLWMLIFLKNDIDGVKKSALPAAVAAVAITAVYIIVPYAMVELFSLGIMPKIGFDMIVDVVQNLWFALPLIMFMPKKPDDAAYLFSGLFLLGVVSGALSQFFMTAGGSAGLALSGISPILSVLEAIAMIGIVYIAGTYGRKT